MAIRIAMMLCCLSACVVSAAAGQKAAVFPFELIEASQLDVGGLPFGGLKLGGVPKEEKRRLVLVDVELAELMRRDGRYDVADLVGLAAEIEAASPLHKCNGCEADIAKKAGADLAVSGTVEKFSDTLLNVSIFVREAASGTLKQSMSTVIQGNTDEAWLRGVRWLAKNRLLTEGGSQ